jgi:hypothetical protein
MWDRVAHVLASGYIFHSAMNFPYSSFVFSFVVVVVMVMLSHMWQHSVRADDVQTTAFQELCTSIFGHVYVSFLWGHSFLLANTSMDHGHTLILWVILVTSTH